MDKWKKKAPRGGSAHPTRYTVPAHCKVRQWIYPCAATRRQAGYTLYKDLTLLHSTITLTDALPVQERRRGGEQRREDVGQSAEPHNLHCG